jgi:hypothetical protein
VTATVSITYDEAIQPSSVTPGTFAVHAMRSGQLLDSLSVNGATIELDPPGKFKPGELVYASATTGTLSQVDGMGPLTPTVWSFYAATGGGTSHFWDTYQVLGEPKLSFSLDVALGDVDGDGDLDAWVTTTPADHVWLNNGSGLFTDSGQRLGVTSSRHARLGDLDGDGDLDAVTVTPRQNDYFMLWKNNGSGVFSGGGVPLGDAKNSSVALGDLDGDGDLDVFLSRDGANMVLFNDGNAVFTDSGQLLGAKNTFKASLGDVDGDGDLDAVTANSRSDSDTSKLWLNNGDGTFVEAQDLVFAPTNAVDMGDLDSDGDLDIFFGIARGEGQYSAPNRVWFNDGTGVFTDTGQLLGTYSSNDGRLGDLDGDGDLDVAVANLYPDQNEVWMNDGSGFFNRGTRFFGRAYSHSIALGDVNGDGDLDAFFTHWGLTDNVWINLDTYHELFLPLTAK